MPRYSIVTPVFNSFNLMTKYFDSLENQSFKDFEVIIVDDCSTDGSYEQLQNVCQNSPLNITLLKTETNSGPGVARNIGMDVAQGKWLTFIDNDDWIDTNLFERIEKVFSEYDVNCVIFDYYIQSEKKRTVSRSMYHGDNGEVSLAKCMIYARNHTFCKVYDLEKCRENNIRFPAVRRCEDVAFVCRAIDACGKVYYLKEPMYYYYRRQTSLSNNKEMGEQDMVKAFSYLEDTLSGKYPNELSQKSVTDILYGAVLMMCKAGKPNSQIKAYIQDYSQKHQNWEDYEIVKYVGKAKQLFLKMISLRLVVLLKILSKAHSKVAG